MRKTIGILVFLGFVGVVHSGDDDAIAIVNKAIKASGGEANLAKFDTMSWKEKGTYYGMGVGLPYIGNFAISNQDKFRMEIEGVFTLVVSGDKGWISSMGEVKEMAAEHLAEQHTMLRAGWIGSLLPLKKEAFALKMLPDAKVGDALASVVLVTRKNYPDVKLYFDKKSGHRVKSEYRNKASDLKFKEVTMELYYSDYRVVDGASLPHKVVLKRDGGRYVEAESVEIRAAAKLDPKTFAKPQ